MSDDQSDTRSSGNDRRPPRDETDWTVAIVVCDHSKIDRSIFTAATISKTENRIRFVVHVASVFRTRVGRFSIYSKTILLHIHTHTYSSLRKN